MSADATFIPDGDSAAILAAAADLLGRVRFDTMQPGDIGAQGTALAVVKGRYDLAQAAYATRLQELSDNGRCAPPEDEIGRRGKMSGGDAAKAARHARILAQFRAFAAALGDGAISSGHVDVLARFHHASNDSDRAELVQDGDRLAWQAAQMGVDEFRRALAKRRADRDAKNMISEAEKHHRRNKALGGYDAMINRYQWTLDLDRETGARVETAVTAEIDRMRTTGELEQLHPDLTHSEAHLRAYAVANLISRGYQFTNADPDNPVARGVAELGVLTDIDTLLHGQHDHSVCELEDGYPFPVEAMRRHACTAGIYPVVLNGDGVALDVGREQRLANRAHRRALRGMYRTCAATDCAVPFGRCQIHHIEWWENGGTTDLSNLVPLCVRHHHLVHDQGWRISLDDARTLHLYRPQGEWHSSQPLRPLVGQVANETSIDGASPPIDPGGGPPGEQLSLVA